MKLKEFQKELASKKIDIALILNSGYNKKDPNLFYFLQKEIDFGCLAVPKKGKPSLFAPGFEYFKVKEQNPKGISVSKSKKKGLFSTIKSRFGKRRKIGINKDVFSVSELAKLRKAFKRLDERFEVFETFERPEGPEGLEGLEMIEKFEINFSSFL